MSELTGQVALVTGGARGIGRGIVTQLARAGADVVVADVLDTAESVAAVEKLGRAALGVECDVRVSADAEAAVQTALDHLGRLDIVCANAGVLRMMPITELTLDEWQRHIDINLTGVFVTCKAAMPHFLAQRKGCYVNTASVSGLRGSHSLGHYGATKAAVINFTQALAIELGPHGIRANCVLPGSVVTELSMEAAMRVGLPRDRAAAAIADAALPRIPLGRLQTPDDIGQAVVYLCQADAVTGTSINVSGGGTL